MRAWLLRGVDRLDHLYSRKEKVGIAIFALVVIPAVQLVGHEQWGWPLPNMVALVIAAVVFTVGPSLLRGVLER